MQLTAQTFYQARLHPRPFAIQNAEVDRISDPPGVRDQMPAEGTFFFCSDAKNRIAGFLIECISLQFDANASPDFEGVTQHQILRFGIDSGTLPGWSDPGGTNFYSAIGTIDVHEARAADDAAGGSFHGGEDDGFAAFLFRDGFCG